MIDSYKTIIEKEQYSFVKSLDIEYNEEEFTYGELLIKEKEAIGLSKFISRETFI